MRNKVLTFSPSPPFSLNGLIVRIKQLLGSLYLKKPLENRYGKGNDEMIINEDHEIFQFK